MFPMFTSKDRIGADRRLASRYLSTSRDVRRVAVVWHYAANSAVF